MNDIIRKHCWYNFRNCYGEVVACAEEKRSPTVVINSEVVRQVRYLLVGFAFCNPVDFCLKRSIRVSRGTGISRKRLNKCPIKVNFHGDEPAYDAIVRHLLQSYPEDYEDDQNAIGVRWYEGAFIKCAFVQWFPKFRDELRRTFESEKVVEDEKITV